jgi:short-subunit dehydrogenase
MNLEGRTALITGASRGIGRALAEALAREPLDRLLLGERSPERHRPLLAPPGGARELAVVRVELSSREEIERSLDELGPALDSIDLLVNNAGTFEGGLLERQDLDAIYEIVQVNLAATMHLTHRILPSMLSRGDGKIVNQASVVGYVHFPGVTSYAATKSGVVGFTQALRRELRDTSVSVLELATGGIDTDMMDKVKAELDEHASTDGWDQYEPEEWAEKIVAAIRSDDDVLGPGGKAALAKLASRGPGSVLDAASAAGFNRGDER